MSKIILESLIPNDNYTEYVFHHYDIQNRVKTVSEIPIPSEEDMRSIMNTKWNIMLICGKSGSGKSTILRNFGNVGEIQYDREKAVISQFPDLSEEDACELLSGVGLASVPTWLRHPQELSNGEKARFDLCMSIYSARKDQYILVDEFTSVVNRDAAKSMSFALQRYVRQKDLKIVIASCHFDIIEWLQPDYIFNLNHRDEDGNVEMERLVYDDYDSYKQEQYIKSKDILSEARKI